MSEVPIHTLRRCAVGDRNAQRTVYETYADRVYRSALHLLGQASDAEDATQDVFLRLFVAAAGFDGRSKVSTWLYRMTVNHCLNLRKRSRLRRHRPIDDSDPLVSPDEAPDRGIEKREARDRLHDLLRRLPERDSTILVLREIEQLSYAEIAGILDIPEGTVMSRLSRARTKLQGLVDSTRHPQAQR